MPVVTLDASSQALFVPGGGQVLIVNGDEADTMYAGPQRPVTTSDVPIPPQGSVTLDGSVQWFGSTCEAATEIAAYVLPGGTDWANPVGVQIALETLGLALNSTVEATNSQLGTGVAPAVANYATAQQLRAAAQTPTAFLTMPAAGRIWRASLHYCVETDDSFSAGPTQLYAEVATGSGITLAICETGVSGPTQAVPDSADIEHGGLAVAEGDTVLLDVNNGNVLSDGAMRASAFVGYSIP